MPLFRHYTAFRTHPRHLDRTLQLVLWRQSIYIRTTCVHSSIATISRFNRTVTGHIESSSWWVRIRQVRRNYSQSFIRRERREHPCLRFGYLLFPLLFWRKLGKRHWLIFSCTFLLKILITGLMVLFRLIDANRTNS